MSTPQSIINICSGVRMDNRYEHSIYFADASAQLGYFAGKVVKTFPAYSYLRKSWPLQVQATMEEARKWNYLYFRNGTGKYYFYFINQIEYKNDNTVELTLELDVIQTYLFDFELLECFVERQHTTSDKLGEHTVDEGLELGELVTTSSKDVSMSTMCILVMSSIDIGASINEDDDEPVKMIGSYYDGIFGGTGIFAVEASEWRALGNILLQLDNKGWSDSIISIWMYPKKLITLDTGSDWSTVINKVASIKPFFEYVNRPTVLNGYAPKNNKLLMYPYCLLYATNNGNTGAVYQFERFGDPEECGFKILGALTPEGSVRMYPLNYNGEQHAYDHGVTLGSFPTCAWNQDVYKLWLAQNQNQQQNTVNTAGLAIAGGAITAIASLYTGNVMGVVGGAGAVIGGAQQIGALLAQRKDMSIQPPQSKGQVSSSVNTVAGFQTFTLKTKTITKEMARILDDYFTCYGYKINRVQKPNISARPAFTYVKTVGCHIKGDMCTEDITKVESIFDKGITFWKNGNKIADYTQENNV